MPLDMNTPVAQVRLLVGDTSTDIESQYLPDSIYEWFLSENGGNVHDAAVEALECIINQIALAPEEWRLGDASETRTSLESLERRLFQLKAKRNKAKNRPVPMILHTDRKNWDVIDRIYGGGNNE